LLDRAGFSGIDPRAKAGRLSVARQQMVEIAKALVSEPRMLILDEPSAVLSPPEVRELWQVLRALRDAGGTIVLITHKLDEVIDVSETITVMRAGRTVARMATASTTAQAIARAMVGRDVALALDAEYTGVPAAQQLGAVPAMLEVRDLTVLGASGHPTVKSVGFSIAPGEILGIAGVEGNGQTELIEAIAGLRHATGTIALGGRDLVPLDVRRRGDAGLSHIPEDRHERALVLDYSVAENLILGQQHRFTRGAALDGARILAHARSLISHYDIRPPEPALSVRALSGGNQQKVVVAREMARDFKVLLAAQPTRGVDVGAIEFIHARLREAREQGKAVLLVSADLAEVLALSDRVAVMYGGRIVALLPRSEASPETLGPYMTGAERAA
jgi:simple sugar transport system ATP-binding protein